MPDTDPVLDVIAGMSAENVEGGLLTESGGEAQSEETQPEPAQSEEDVTVKESDAEPTPEPSLEIDGQTFTAKEIRDLKAGATRAAELEAELRDASTEKEALSVWREMHNLAQKNPELREKLAAVFSEFEKKLGDDGEPIKERELTEEEKLRNTYLDDVIKEHIESQVQKASAEIDAIVETAAKEYEGLIPENPITEEFTGKYDKWLFQVLLPAVKQTFKNEEGVGSAQVEMVLNHFLIKNGAIKAASKKGAEALASRLAKEPPGSRIVRGESTRKDSSPPEVSFKGLSLDEMFAKTDPSQFIKNGR